jgi:DNA-binding response OmpR family regulator
LNTRVVTEGPQRVLVVEDDDDLRSLIGLAVADAGYACVQAADASRHWLRAPSAIRT